MDISVAGHTVINEKIHKISMERFGPASFLQKLYFLGEFIFLAISSRKYVRQSKVASKELADCAKLIIDKSNKAINLFEGFNELASIYETLNKNHVATSMGVSIAETIALGIVCHGSEGI